MKRPMLLLAVSLVLGAVSCNRNAPPGGSSEGPGLSGSAAATAAARQENPALNIPAGARWTIFCAAVGGENHSAQAKATRDQLIRTTGLRDFYVVSGENESTLYYGFYRSISEEEDKREAARAKADCKALSVLNNAASGRRMFAGVFLVSLDAADPPAPAEWNLVNAKGHYSLQIGVYKDNPRRKEAAVEAVREARAQGIQAYYYHGPTASSVCVGTWPADAVQQEGDTRSRDPGAVPMLLPQGINVSSNARTVDGKPVEVVRPKLVVRDPTLEELVRKYPYQLINGGVRVMTNPQTGERKVLQDPSILVLVPGADENAAVARTPTVDPNAPTPSNPAADLAIPPQISAQPPRPAGPADPWRVIRPPGQLPASKGGKLRSLED